MSLDNRRAFTICDEPRGKGRPRFRVIPNKNPRGTPRYFVQTYTPEGTVVYENMIKTEFRKKYQGVSPIPSTVSLAILVDAYCPIPASASKAMRELMLTDEIRPGKKPDTDNIGKAVLDALNGVAYEDDKQVVDLHIRKWYDNIPRVEVQIIEALRIKRKKKETEQCKMEL